MPALKWLIVQLRVDVSNVPFTQLTSILLAKKGLLNALHDPYKFPVEGDLRHQTNRSEQKSPSTEWASTPKSLKPPVVDEHAT